MAFRKAGAYVLIRKKWLTCDGAFPKCITGDVKVCAHLSRVFACHNGGFSRRVGQNSADTQEISVDQISGPLMDQRCVANDNTNVGVH